MTQAMTKVLLDYMAKKGWTVSFDTDEMPFRWTATRGEHLITASSVDQLTHIWSSFFPDEVFRVSRQLPRIRSTGCPSLI